MATLSDPSNASRATPNIPIEKASLHIGSSTFITAPSPKVWAVLTDTSTWPTWNSFVPHVTIRSQPTEPTPTKSAHPPSQSNAPTTNSLSPILQKGTRFTFHVRMDPTSTSEKPQPATDVHLLISEFSPPNPETGSVGRIVWTGDYDAPGTMSRSLLMAERVHEIMDVEGGTEVRNWEAQVGWVVFMVRMMYGVRLQANFELWVADLKRFVESGDGN
ncbi:hypothetical protein N7541_004723 [Penicillium brevicompactum]|uniref:Polyketide cyclase/dehydrase n=1 Tax=Penicillium brevicompactum TaxID=5074 RepID=A0A9W9UW67_PENBR|nr:hypothetical protein N7541_004723 [Penicillium brevicompactum]